MGSASREGESAQVAGRRVQCSEDIFHLLEWGRMKTYIYHDNSKEGKGQVVFQVVAGTALEADVLFFQKTGMKPEKVSHIGCKIRCTATEECKACHGTGQDDPPPGKYHGICSECNGTGRIECKSQK